MKKILFCMFLATSCINASISEELENAIKTADFIWVKNYLETASLSEKELSCLVDLSQQMIQYRRGEIECERLSCRLNSQQCKYAMGLFASIYAGIIIPFVPAFAFDFDNQKMFNRQTNLFVIAGLSTCIASFVFCKNKFKQLVQEKQDSLEKNFDNAVAIRQLLLKKFLYESGN